jgi:hypothetical protein
MKDHSLNWGWIRFNDGSWCVAMPDNRDYLINAMKAGYQQKGNVLYSDEIDDIPEGRIQEETFTYIVVYWYSSRREEKLERIQTPVNIYWPNFGEGRDRFIGTLNAVGDE